MVADPEAYDDEVRREISLCIADLEPGGWGQVGLCPGPFGCPHLTDEARHAAGLPDTFCPGCRVIHVYRAAEA